MIYDNDIISGKEGITSSNTDVNTYILGLPSQKYESSASNSGKVQIALEVRNDGVAFKGKDGIIPTGATFYLVGNLSLTFEMTSDVILTTVGRKNSLQGVEALMVQCHSEVQSTEESPAKRMSF